MSLIRKQKSQAKNQRLVELQRFKKQKHLVEAKQKEIKKRRRERTKKWSKIVIERKEKSVAGKLISLTNYKPNVQENIVELSQIKKSYFTSVESKVISNISLKIEFGDFVAILGPSGSGKTTLLNIISGLDVADEGDVFVRGYNLSLLKDAHLTKFRRENIGFIFQEYGLLPNLTARENVEVTAHLCPKKNRDRYVLSKLFKVIGMENQMDKYPYEMSGGEQQRVAIARALAKSPAILFGDEPTGALDEAMGRRVLSILKDVNGRYGTTFIIVTHDLAIASICNKIIHIKDGHVIKQEINRHPKSPGEINWE